MNNHLLVFDYDDTVARTSDRSPNDMNVEQAYFLAINDVFSADANGFYLELEEDFAKMSPEEIVQTVYRLAKLGGIEIRQYDTFDAAVTALVEAKLAHLVREITPQWPGFYEGAEDFFKVVEEGYLPVDVGIVSSGHHGFISRTFEVKGLKPPDILITSDDLRGVAITNRELYKPNTYQLALAHRQWESPTDSSAYSDRYFWRGHGKPQMMYVGNDPKRDAGMAWNSRVVFGFMPNTDPRFVPDEKKGQLLIPDFNELTRLLVENAQELRDGEPLSDILLRVPDREVFPATYGLEAPFTSVSVETSSILSMDRR